MMCSQRERGRIGWQTIPLHASLCIPLPQGPGLTGACAVLGKERLTNFEGERERESVRERESEREEKKKTKKNT